MPGPRHGAAPCSIYSLEGTIDKHRGAPPASQGLGQMVQGVLGDKVEQSVLSERTGPISKVPGARLGDGKRALGRAVWWAKAQGAEFGEPPMVYLME